MSFWKLCKNGRLGKNSNGTFVDRESYEQIVKENNFLKEELTLDNFCLKIAYLVDNNKFDSSQRLAITLYLDCVKGIIAQINSQNAFKDKEITGEDKGKKLAKPNLL